MTAYRYAIFFAPRRGNAFWAWGSEFLGRDAFTGEPLAQPLLSGIDPDRLYQVTSETRKYGLHGTLKPPFRLAQDTTRGMLRAAVAEFAATQKPFRLNGLKVSRIARFLALTPITRSKQIDALAEVAMREFDHFRGPATEPELTRRRRAGLSDRQEELLQRWGYPYVMEEYRFHMSLTGPLREGEAEPLEAAINDRFAAMLAQPLDIECLWLFEQNRVGAQVRAVEQHMLGEAPRLQGRRIRSPASADAATAGQAR
jgi:putative phosphonate metabolism protein